MKATQNCNNLSVGQAMVLQLDPRQLPAQHRACSTLDKPDNVLLLTIQTFSNGQMMMAAHHG